MDELQLFKITENDIIETDFATPEEIVLVYDKGNKNLYIYKGKYSPSLDEFQAGALYERIINRFLNPNIYLLKDLVAKPKDSEQIIRIKEFIVDHFPNIRVYRIKRVLKDVFTLGTLRKKIKTFKNYENSRIWRQKLSNTTNLWKLSIFNVIMLISIIIVIVSKVIIELNRQDFIFINNNLTLNPELWNLWLETLSYTLAICAIILFIGFIVNLLFVLFPLRFPINPNAIATFSSARFDHFQKEKIMKQLTSKIKMPPSVPQPPTLPSMKAKQPKSTQKIKTPTLPKIDISLTPKKISKTPVNIATAKKEEIDEILNIPPPPLKKKIKTPLISQLNEEEIKKLSKKDTPTTKYIIIDCPICQKNLAMPVPRQLVSEAKEPVVEISYLHGRPEHVLVAQLDHNFEVRRRRASWVVKEKDFE